MYLKLRWARFFTLAGWNWKLANRSGFDFQVTIPCPGTDCKGGHPLLVRISEKKHDALERKHDELFDTHFMYSVPSPALFGDGPGNTHWQMICGDGGGCYTVSYFLNEMPELWERAAHE